MSPDGVTGFTVSPRSSDEMAAALNRLLDDQHLREKMGRAARARVVNEFDIAEMAARTLDLYRSVLEIRANSFEPSHRCTNAIKQGLLSTKMRIFRSRPCAPRATDSAFVRRRVSS